MKNIKIITTAIVALAIGLGLGFVLFRNTGLINEHVHLTPASPAGGQSTDQPVDGSPKGQATTYTCSMHPQVRQDEPGLCPICEMDLIPLEVNTSNDPMVLEMTKESVKLANIQTTVIGKKSTKTGKTIRLSGKVQMDERLASSQVAHVPGRIEKLFVTFTGEQVSKGQRLATLYSPELITAQKELLEALKLQDLNPGLADAARNKLRYWKIGNATIKEIEQKGEIRETFSMYADKSGIVTNKRVAVGDYLKQGEPLFDLISLHKVWVLFDAYEEDLATISIGDRIEFTTPSIPDRTFKTRITFIDPLINADTRVASLRTEVSNASGLLKPEMFVTGVLKNQTVTNTQLTVPKSAVLWTGKRSVVYVKVPNTDIPSFQFREVELGEASGEGYQILNGLEPREEVVTYGNFSIDAAAQLNNQASMMNRDVKLKKENSGVPNFHTETPDQFKKQLHALTDEYILLKDAFVATDAKTAANAAEKVLAQLHYVDMGLVKEQAHLYWMEQQLALQAHGKKIAESDNVEDQRRQFSLLSDAMINSIEAFGTEGDTLYVAHCPMAFNNQGADWLSAEKQIRNPYFGDKMMTCGAVKKTFFTSD